MDKQAITAYICRLYGFKQQMNINEARYQMFLKMSGMKHGEKKIVPEETNNEIDNFELVNSTTEGIEVVITTTKDRDINKSVDLIDDNAVTGLPL